jgi:hypothetical protein
VMRRVKRQQCRLACAARCTWVRPGCRLAWPSCSPLAARRGGGGGRRGRERERGEAGWRAEEERGPARSSARRADQRRKKGKRKEERRKKGRRGRKRGKERKEKKNRRRKKENRKKGMRVAAGRTGELRRRRTGELRQWPAMRGTRAPVREGDVGGAGRCMGRVTAGARPAGHDGGATGGARH